MTAVGRKSEFVLNVNGETRTVTAYPMERLLDVLRTELALTGAKEGCGACAILMDGEIVDSCLIPVLQATGARILTIEGLSGDKKVRALQETFLEYGGAQCGICTPGMILAAVSLLNKNPRPSMEDIREGLSGNLCRCTGYTQIFEAVAEAARRNAAT